jgi:hypothetical protein
MCDCDCVDTIPVGSQGLRGLTGAAGATGATGAAGASSYIYIAFATDNTGTGWTEVPASVNASHGWIAILNSPTAIPVRTQAHYNGLWTIRGGGINTHVIPNATTIATAPTGNGNLCYVQDEHAWYRHNGAVWVCITRTGWIALSGLPNLAWYGGGTGTWNKTTSYIKYKVIDNDTVVIKLHLDKITIPVNVTSFSINLAGLMPGRLPKDVLTNQTVTYADVGNFDTYQVVATFTNTGLMFIGFTAGGSINFPATADAAFNFTMTYEMI